VTDDQAPPAGQLPAMLTVATITKLHGIRGELKLRATPEYVEFLRQAAIDALALTLHLPNSGDEYEVTLASVRGHESAPIIAIDGVDHRDDAEQYRGAQVRVARELLPETEQDEYYLGDLDGCIVHDSATGTPIGRVTQADALPANVVLTIALDAGGTLLAPLAGDAVPLVDIDARRIDVDIAFLGLEDPDA
jgi:16S rRNA processing protein RimM